jgi:protein pelota
MRILYKDLKHGVVKIIPESTDDLWILATLIQPGDLVKARTVREIHFGERGSGRSSRIPMVLTVRVENVEFQAFTTRLRVRGVVVEGPEKYGVKGKYHTLSIDVGQELTVIKPMGWPQALLERLEKSVPTAKALVVAVDYDEYAIGLVQGQGVKIMVSSSLYLPGKDDPRREERLREAVSTIAKQAAEIARREEPTLIVVAGPGRLKNIVFEKLKELFKHEKARIVVDDVSMGGEAGIYEEMRRGAMRKALQEVASVEAESIMEEFERRLAKEPQTIAYTLEKVYKAAEAGAIDTLLILDELLHSPDEETRKRAYDLLRLADASRARIYFVSKEAPVAHKLKGLGGVVALLRYAFDLDWQPATT